VDDEEQPTFTIPTELERRDGWLDITILGGAVLAIWQLSLGLYLPFVGKLTLPLTVTIPLAIPVVVEVLTGEPAGDIQYIGALATGMRSALGLRRAHEWVFAFLHYTRVVQYPAAKVRCVRFLRLAQKRIWAWRARLIEVMRQRRLQRHLWGFSTRYKLSGRRLSRTITTNGTSRHG
jgi:hypothetical protein